MDTTPIWIGGGILGAAGLAIMAYAPKTHEFQIVSPVGAILALFGVFVIILAIIFNNK